MRARSRVLSAAAAAALLALPVRDGAAQDAPALAAVPVAPPVEVMPNVDTVGAPARAIFALWRAYLGARPRAYARAPQWSRAEQRRWPVYDLATPSAYATDAEYARTRATVLAVEPARPGDTTAYVIRTLFTRAEPGSGAPATGRAARELPVALVRVDAVREDDRWALAGALPRLTADWRRTAVGAFTFVYPPEHRFDAGRARRAVRFVDSLAAAFGVPRPAGVTYYVARTPEEVFRLAGVDYTPPGATGRAVPADGLVFSGLPAWGEFYPHELTHLALEGPAAALGAPATLREGLAVWRGGMPALRAALSPRRTPATRDVGRDVAPDVLDGAERALGLARAAIEAAWRGALTRMPNGDRTPEPQTPPR